MNPNESGIFSLASVGRYLDALSSITAEMSLRDRSALIYLDKRLHEHWHLGKNVILNWCPEAGGISVLVIPHFAVAEFSGNALYREDAPQIQNGGHVRPSEEFVRSLLASSRQLSSQQMRKVSRLLSVAPTHIALPDPVPDAQTQIIEMMVKRYSISYVAARAAALFDIVGFSLLSPFEQMSQLNSLSYSLNSAQSRLMSKKIDISFARSSTGDGFYIWNRDLSLEANINLYHFMQLVLADNAIAQSKSHSRTTPRLRTCFHVGSCYEFHQAEGLSPTLYNYIVGDLTIDLARMIESALPEQILIGEFSATLSTVDDAIPPDVSINSQEFITSSTEQLAKLEGMELAGEQVNAIKCYLTGRPLGGGRFSIRQIAVNDKHGVIRQAYNAKVNIYRQNAEPIFLGIEDKELEIAGRYASDDEHKLREITI